MEREAMDDEGVKSVTQINNCHRLVGTHCMLCGAFYVGGLHNVPAKRFAAREIKKNNKKAR